MRWNPFSGALGFGRFATRRPDDRLFRDSYIVNGKRGAGGAVKFGDAFVEVGLGLELAAAGGEQSGLPLLDEEKGSRAGPKLALLAFVKLFGGDAPGDGRRQLCLAGTQRL